MSTAVSAPRTPRRSWLVVLFVLLVAIAIGGFLFTEFQCDDAYIAFRHVHNAHAGHGLVWNPPPFRPVEGYTSFLWVTLLWGVWETTGLEPTVAANPIALAFGILTLLLCMRVAIRLLRHGADSFVIVVALLAVAANRTFVTWLSSGLETAAFQFFLLWWLERASVPAAERSRRWLLVLATAASLTALARPDGLLFVGATVVIAWLERRRWSIAATVSCLLPLAAVVAHELWRRWTYGVWFPNTYYAKVSTPWPDAGIRYFACFVFEHGVWVPIILSLLAAPVAVARRLRARQQAAAAPPAADAVAAAGRPWPALVAATAVAGQVGYYLFRVGGDHFEYRVLAPLVPIAALGTAALLGWLRWPRVVGRALIVAFGLAASVGWGVLAYGKTECPYVSERVPRFLRPVTRVFDGWQAYLQLRRIGVRREFHAQFAAEMAATVGAVPPGLFDADTLPVVATPCVGIIGWAVRDGCYVIDTFGLCDYVIARNVQHLPTAAERAALAPQLLAIFDPDASGTVDRDEFLHMMTRYGDAVSHRLKSDDCMWQSLLLLHDADDDGVLSGDERLAAVESLLPLRVMAHERRSPPGYRQEFRPNVTLQDGRVVVLPRGEPLTAADVERAEQIWWAWADDPTQPLPK